MTDEVDIKEAPPGFPVKRSGYYSAKPDRARQRETYGPRRFSPMLVIAGMLCIIAAILFVFGEVLLAFAVLAFAAGISLVAIGWRDTRSNQDRDVAG